MKQSHLKESEKIKMSLLWFNINKRKTIKLSILKDLRFCNNAKNKKCVKIIQGVLDLRR